MSERPVVDGATVLWIGSSSSECGACGLTCLPHEPTHATLCGYDQHPGCGARYTHVAPIYFGSADAVRQMRPDLTFVDPYRTEGATR